MVRDSLVEPLDAPLFGGAFYAAFMGFYHPFPTFIPRNGMVSCISPNLCLNVKTYFLGLLCVNFDSPLILLDALICLLVKVSFRGKVSF